ncbi:MAG: hypothetical protein QG604_538 [Candidatus Dependentiae bacterium]|nr:hypothetical protein [Candidatus Dependentiae bacterium]
MNMRRCLLTLVLFFYSGVCNSVDPYILEHTQISASHAVGWYLTGGPYEDSVALDNDRFTGIATLTWRDHHSLPIEDSAFVVVWDLSVGDIDWQNRTNTTEYTFTQSTHQWSNLSGVTWLYTPSSKTWTQTAGGSQVWAFDGTVGHWLYSPSSSPVAWAWDRSTFVWSHIPSGTTWSYDFTAESWAAVSNPESLTIAIKPPLPVLQQMYARETLTAALRSGALDGEGNTTFLFDSGHSNSSEYTALNDDGYFKAVYQVADNAFTATFINDGALLYDVVVLDALSLTHDMTFNDFTMSSTLNTWWQDSWAYSGSTQKWVDGQTGEEWSFDVSTNTWTGPGDESWQSDAFGLEWSQNDGDAVWTYTPVDGHWSYDDGVHAWVWRYMMLAGGWQQVSVHDGEPASGLPPLVVAQRAIVQSIRTVFGNEYSVTETSSTTWELRGALFNDYALLTVPADGSAPTIAWRNKGDDLLSTPDATFSYNLATGSYGWNVPGGANPDYTFDGATSLWATSGDSSVFHYVVETKGWHQTVGGSAAFMYDGTLGLWNDSLPNQWFWRPQNSLWVATDGDFLRFDPTAGDTQRAWLQQVFIRNIVNKFLAAGILAGTGTTDWTVGNLDAGEYVLVNGSADFAMIYNTVSGIVQGQSVSDTGCIDAAVALTSYDIEHGDFTWTRTVDPEWPESWVYASTTHRWTDRQTGEYWSFDPATNTWTGPDSGSTTWQSDLLTMQWSQNDGDAVWSYAPSLGYWSYDDGERSWVWSYLALAGTWQQVSLYDGEPATGLPPLVVVQKAIIDSLWNAVSMLSAVTDNGASSGIAAQWTLAGGIFNDHATLTVPSGGASATIAWRNNGHHLGTTPDAHYSHVVSTGDSSWYIGSGGSPSSVYVGSTGIWHDAASSLIWHYDSLAQTWTQTHGGSQIWNFDDTTGYWTSTGSSVHWLWDSRKGVWIDVDGNAEWLYDLTASSSPWRALSYGASLPSRTPPLPLVQQLYSRHVYNEFLSDGVLAESGKADWIVGNPISGIYTATNSAADFTATYNTISGDIQGSSVGAYAFLEGAVSLVSYTMETGDFTWERSVDSRWPETWQYNSGPGLWMDFQTGEQWSYDADTNTWTGSDEITTWRSDVNALQWTQNDGDAVWTYAPSNGHWSYDDGLHTWVWRYLALAGGWQQISAYEGEPEHGLPPLVAVQKAILDTLYTVFVDLCVVTQTSAGHWKMTGGYFDDYATLTVSGDDSYASIAWRNNGNDLGATPDVRFSYNMRTAYSSWYTAASESPAYNYNADTGHWSNVGGSQVWVYDAGAKIWTHTVGGSQVWSFDTATGHWVYDLGGGGSVSWLWQPDAGQWQHVADGSEWIYDFTMPSAPWRPLSAADLPSVTPPLPLTQQMYSRKILNNFLAAGVFAESGKADWIVSGPSTGAYSAVNSVSDFIVGCSTITGDVHGSFISGHPYTNETFSLVSYSIEYGDFVWARSIDPRFAERWQYDSDLATWTDLQTAEQWTYDDATFTWIAPDDTTTWLSGQDGLSWIKAGSSHAWIYVPSTGHWTHNDGTHAWEWRYLALAGVWQQISSRPGVPVGGMPPLVAVQKAFIDSLWTVFNELSVISQTSSGHWKLTGGRFNDYATFTIPTDSSLSTITWRSNGNDLGATPETHFSYALSTGNMSWYTIADSDPAYTYSASGFLWTNADESEQWTYDSDGRTWTQTVGGDSEWYFDGTVGYWLMSGGLPWRWDVDSAVWIDTVTGLRWFYDFVRNEWQSVDMASSIPTEIPPLPLVQQMFSQRLLFLFASVLPEGSKTDWITNSPVVDDTILTVNNSDGDFTASFDSNAGYILGNYVSSYLFADGAVSVAANLDTGGFAWYRSLDPRWTDVWTYDSDEQIWVDGQTNETWAYDLDSSTWTGGEPLVTWQSNPITMEWIQVSDEVESLWTFEPATGYWSYDDGDLVWQWKYIFLTGIWEQISSHAGEPAQGLPPLVVVHKAVIDTLFDVFTDTAIMTHESDRWIARGGYFNDYAVFTMPVDNADATLTWRDRGDDLAATPHTNFLYSLKSGSVHWYTAVSGLPAYTFDATTGVWTDYISGDVWVFNAEETSWTQTIGGSQIWTFNSTTGHWVADSSESWHWDAEHAFWLYIGGSTTQWLYDFTVSEDPWEGLTPDAPLPTVRPPLPLVQQLYRVYVLNQFAPMGVFDQCGKEDLLFSSPVVSEASFTVHNSDDNFTAVYYPFSHEIEGHLLSFVTVYSNSESDSFIWQLRLDPEHQKKWMYDADAKTWTDLQTEEEWLYNDDTHKWSHSGTTWQSDVTGLSWSKNSGSIVWVYDPLTGYWSHNDGVRAWQWSYQMVTDSWLQISSHSGTPSGGLPPVLVVQKAFINALWNALNDVAVVTEESPTEWIARGGYFNDYAVLTVPDDSDPATIAWRNKGNDLGATSDINFLRILTTSDESWYLSGSEDPAYTFDGTESTWSNAAGTNVWDYDASSKTWTQITGGSQVWTFDGVAGEWIYHNGSDEAHWIWNGTNALWHDVATGSDWLYDFVETSSPWESSNMADATVPTITPPLPLVQQMYSQNVLNAFLVEGVFVGSGQADWIFDTDVVVDELLRVQNGIGDFVATYSVNDATIEGHSISSYSFADDAISVTANTHTGDFTWNQSINAQWQQQWVYDSVSHIWTDNQTGKQWLYDVAINAWADADEVIWYSNPITRQWSDGVSSWYYIPSTGYWSYDNGILVSQWHYNYLAGTWKQIASGDDGHAYPLSFPPLVVVQRAYLDSLQNVFSDNAVILQTDDGEWTALGGHFNDHAMLTIPDDISTATIVWRNNGYDLETDPVIGFSHALATGDTSWYVDGSSDPAYTFVAESGTWTQISDSNEWVYAAVSRTWTHSSGDDLPWSYDTTTGYWVYGSGSEDETHWMWHADKALWQEVATTVYWIYDLTADDSQWKPLTSTESAPSITPPLALIQQLYSKRLVYEFLLAGAFDSSEKNDWIFNTPPVADTVFMISNDANDFTAVYSKQAGSLEGNFSNPYSLATGSVAVSLNTALGSFTWQRFLDQRLPEEWAFNTVWTDGQTGEQWIYDSDTLTWHNGVDATEWSGDETGLVWSKRDSSVSWTYDLSAGYWTHNDGENQWNWRYLFFAGMWQPYTAYDARPADGFLPLAIVQKVFVDSLSTLVGNTTIDVSVDEDSGEWTLQGGFFNDYATITPSDGFDAVLEWRNNGIDLEVDPAVNFSVAVGTGNILWYLDGADDPAYTYDATTGTWTDVATEDTWAYDASAQTWTQTHGGSQVWTFNATTGYWMYGNTTSSPVDWLWQADTGLWQHVAPYNEWLYDFTASDHPWIALTPDAEIPTTTPPLPLVQQLYAARLLNEFLVAGAFDDEGEPDWILSSPVLSDALLTIENGGNNFTVTYNPEENRLEGSLLSYMNVAHDRTSGDFSWQLSIDPEWPQQWLYDSTSRIWTDQQTGEEWHYSLDTHQWTGPDAVTWHYNDAHRQWIQNDGDASWTYTRSNGHWSYDDGDHLWVWRYILLSQTWQQVTSFDGMPSTGLPPLVVVQKAFFDGLADICVDREIIITQNDENGWSLVGGYFNDYATLIVLEDGSNATIEWRSNGNDLESTPAVTFTYNVSTGQSSWYLDGGEDPATTITDAWYKVGTDIVWEYDAEDVTWTRVSGGYLTWSFDETTGYWITAGGHNWMWDARAAVWIDVTTGYQWLYDFTQPDSPWEALAAEVVLPDKLPPLPLVEQVYMHFILNQFLSGGVLAESSDAAWMIDSLADRTYIAINEAETFTVAYDTVAGEISGSLVSNYDFINGSYTLDSYNVEYGDFTWLRTINSPVVEGWQYRSDLGIWTDQQTGEEWTFNVNTNTWNGPDAVVWQSNQITGEWSQDGGDTVWTYNSGGVWSYDDGDVVWQWRYLALAGVWQQVTSFDSQPIGGLPPLVVVQKAIIDSLQNALGTLFDVEQYDSRHWILTGGYLNEYAVLETPIDTSSSTIMWRDFGSNLGSDPSASFNYTLTTGDSVWFNNVGTSDSYTFDASTGAWADTGGSETWSYDPLVIQWTQTDSGDRVWSYDNVTSSWVANSGEQWAWDIDNGVWYYLADETTWGYNFTMPDTPWNALSLNATLPGVTPPLPLVQQMHSARILRQFLLDGIFDESGKVDWIVASPIVSSALFTLTNSTHDFTVSYDASHGTMTGSRTSDYAFINDAVTVDYDVNTGGFTWQVTIDPRLPLVWVYDGTSALWLDGQTGEEWSYDEAVNTWTGPEDLGAWQSDELGLVWTQNDGDAVWTYTRSNGHWSYDDGEHTWQYSFRVLTNTWEQITDNIGLPASGLPPLIVVQKAFIQSFTGVFDDVPAVTSVEDGVWLLKGGYFNDYATLTFAEDGADATIAWRNKGNALGEDSDTSFTASLRTGSTTWLTPEDTNPVAVFNASTSTWNNFVDGVEPWVYYRATGVLTTDSGATAWVYDSESEAWSHSGQAWAWDSVNGLWTDRETGTKWVYDFTAPDSPWEPLTPAAPLPSFMPPLPLVQLMYVHRIISAFLGAGVFAETATADWVFASPSLATYQAVNGNGDLEVTCTTDGGILSGRYTNGDSLIANSTFGFDYTVETGSFTWFRSIDPLWFEVWRYDADLLTWTHDRTADEWVYDPSANTWTAGETTWQSSLTGTHWTQDGGDTVWVYAPSTGHWSYDDGERTWLWSYQFLAGAWQQISSHLGQPDGGLPPLVAVQNAIIGSAWNILGPLQAVTQTSSTEWHMTGGRFNDYAVLTTSGIDNDHATTITWRNNGRALGDGADIAFTYAVDTGHSEWDSYISEGNAYIFDEVTAEWRDVLSGDTWSYDRTSREWTQTSGGDQVWRLDYLGRWGGHWRWDGDTSLWTHVGDNSEWFYDFKSTESPWRAVSFNAILPDETPPLPLVQQLYMQRILRAFLANGVCSESGLTNWGVFFDSDGRLTVINDPVDFAVIYSPTTHTLAGRLVGPRPIDNGALTFSFDDITGNFTWEQSIDGVATETGWAESLGTVWIYNQSHDEAVWIQDEETLVWVNVTGGIDGDQWRYSPSDGTWIKNDGVAAWLYDASTSLWVHDDGERLWQYRYEFLSHSWRQITTNLSRPANGFPPLIVLQKTFIASIMDAVRFAGGVDKSGGPFGWSTFAEIVATGDDEAFPSYWKSLNAAETQDISYTPAKAAAVWTGNSEQNFFTINFATALMTWENYFETNNPYIASYDVNTGVWMERNIDATRWTYDGVARTWTNADESVTWSYNPGDDSWQSSVTDGVLWYYSSSDDVWSAPAWEASWQYKTAGRFWERLTGSVTGVEMPPVALIHQYYLNNVMYELAAQSFFPQPRLAGSLTAIDDQPDVYEWVRPGSTVTVDLVQEGTPSITSETDDSSVHWTYNPSTGAWTWVQELEISTKTWTYNTTTHVLAGPSHDSWKLLSSSNDLKIWGHYDSAHPEDVTADWRYTPLSATWYDVHNDITWRYEPLTCSWGALLANGDASVWRYDEPSLTWYLVTGTPPEDLTDFQPPSVVRQTTVISTVFDAVIGEPGISFGRVTDLTFERQDDGTWLGANESNRMRISYDSTQSSHQITVSFKAVDEPSWIDDRVQFSLSTDGSWVWENYLNPYRPESFTYDSSTLMWQNNLDESDAWSYNPATTRWTSLSAEEQWRYRYNGHRFSGARLGSTTYHPTTDRYTSSTYDFIANRWSSLPGGFILPRPLTQFIMTYQVMRALINAHAFDTSPLMSWASGAQAWVGSDSFGNGRATYDVRKGYSYYWTDSSGKNQVRYNDTSGEWVWVFDTACWRYTTLHNCWVRDGDPTVNSWYYFDGISPYWVSAGDSSIQWTQQDSSNSWMYTPNFDEWTYNASTGRWQVFLDGKGVFVEWAYNFVSGTWYETSDSGLLPAVFPPLALVQQLFLNHLKASGDAFFAQSSHSAARQVSAPSEHPLYGIRPLTKNALYGRYNSSSILVNAPTHLHNVWYIQSDVSRNLGKMQLPSVTTSALPTIIGGERSTLFGDTWGPTISLCNSIIACQESLVSAGVRWNVHENDSADGGSDTANGDNSSALILYQRGRTHDSGRRRGSVFQLGSIANRMSDGTLSASVQLSSDGVQTTSSLRDGFFDIYRSALTPGATMLQPSTIELALQTAGESGISAKDRSTQILFLAHQSRMNIGWPTSFGSTDNYSPWTIPLSGVTFDETKKFDPGATGGGTLRIAGDNLCLGSRMSNGLPPRHPVKTIDQGGILYVDFGGTLRADEHKDFVLDATIAAALGNGSLAGAVTMPPDQIILAENGRVQGYGADFSAAAETSGDYAGYIVIPKNSPYFATGKPMQSPTLVQVKGRARQRKRVRSSSRR